LGLAGLSPGLVPSIADPPAGGGRTPPANCSIPPLLSPPNAAFCGSQPPNCTFTGCTTGVVMLPSVSVPLAASPALHTTASPPTDSFMSALSTAIGQLVNGL